VPDPPLAMMYYDHSICVGYQREYNVLNDVTGVLALAHARKRRRNATHTCTCHPAVTLC
jgi:hypothetical protein